VRYHRIVVDPLIGKDGFADDVTLVEEPILEKELRADEQWIAGEGGCRRVR
jgi:hypothetical protein